MYIYMCPSLSISVHNDIEMKGDCDTVTLPIPNCIAKDIFAGAIKEEAERDFRGETPIFGIAPPATADYPVAADRPHDHKPIDEDTTSAGGGGSDENGVSSECNNNNSNIANNNNHHIHNNNLMKRKLKDFDEHAEDDFNLVRPPPKRVSPFLNTPKQRKDERKRILRLSVYKLREMEDPENYLRKSVLINNVLRRLHKEIREEKRGYAGFGLGSATSAMNHPYYRPRRFDYDMLNNSYLPTRAAFFFDEPCFPVETEKITDDMTDSLVRSLEASSPPLSPAPSPPPSPSPQTTYPMSTLTQSPLTLSPSSSSSSSTLQIPETPHPDTSTVATSSLTSPLATATDSVMATTTPATAITTIITTTTLPSQLSSTTTTTASSNSEEDMLLGDDDCPGNDVSVSDTDVTTSPVVTNNSTVIVDVTALSSSINHNGITSSRTNTFTINDSSNSPNFGTNKPADISRTEKSEATANVVIGALGCTPTSDSNNNNSNVCNANGAHVFGPSVPVDHVIAPVATSRTSILNNNNNNNVYSSDVTSTNSSVLFSTTNFGSSGFLSVSGSSPFSVGSFVSSSTTMTTAANTVPSLAFQEKQIPVEMDAMFNNLIRVLGET